MGKKEIDQNIQIMLAHRQGWSNLQHAKQQVADWNERKGSSLPRLEVPVGRGASLKRLLMRDG
jgi:hypothetical protein